MKASAEYYVEEDIMYAEEGEGYAEEGAVYLQDVVPENEDSAAAFIDGANGAREHT
ncbi:hypothetical protein EVJ58_g4267 [Rhodofomes roseus]|uniref:Uncharacterized protein n=1 Tax=Rhodofomes roseus TaxID=34475 RepID=A0A4Y9YJ27_9APHY|nr:hypothetical protein EVJ58_g4267 [Rhodofomes roseus]